MATSSVRILKYKIFNLKGFSFSSYNMEDITALARRIYNPEIIEEVGPDFEVPEWKGSKNGKTFNMG
jgi:hypothetical protein